MPRKVVLLLLLALVAPIAALASGCGADDATGVDVAEAAETTGRQGTARMQMEMRLSGMGLPGTLDVDAEGVTALTEPRMDLTIDLAPLAAGMGVPVDDAKARIKIDGRDLYVEVPKIAGLTLPGGASWAALDVAKAVEAFGMDADGLGALFNVDPAAQLRALDAAKGLEEVGEEEVDGVQTTHFRGRLTAQDMINSLPADKREEARKAIESLGGIDKTLDDPFPVEIWIDDEGIVRRMVSEGAVPAESGVPGGKMRLSVELSDFGAELDTSAPPEDDTWDATEALVNLFKGDLAGLLPGGRKNG